MWVSVDLTEQLSARRLSACRFCSDAVWLHILGAFMVTPTSGGQGDFHSRSSEAICLKASRLIVSRNPLVGNDLVVDGREAQFFAERRSVAAISLLPWRAGVPETLSAGQDNARQWSGGEIL